VVAVVALILAAGGAWAYNWSQKQYFVAAQDGKVTIFKGVQEDIPGITLQHVEQVTTVELSALPEFRRQQVEAGIEASSKADAEKTVAELDQLAVQPTPTPSKTPTTKPTPTKTTTSTASNTAWLR
jgi:PPM family protein phosphatase